LSEVYSFGKSALVKAVMRPVSGSEMVVRPRLGNRRRSESWQFVQTPSALIDSWKEARHLDETSGRGILIAGDRGGLAGVLALDQAMKAVPERRTVVAVAGESHVLEHLWIAGTLDGIDTDDDAVVDWEIALYRYAAKVLTPSRVVAEMLRRFGIRSDATVVDIAQDRRVRPVTGPVSRAWLPEAQSRRAQTAKILRSLVDTATDMSIVVSPDAEPDRIWTGTSRAASAQVLEILGPRVQAHRGVPKDVSLVILGDPFALPGPGVSHLRNRRVPVAVPDGSTAASFWPDAFTWTSEEDLHEIVAGRTPPRRPAAAVSIADALTIEPARFDPSRARAVSVGVPVFRDVRFLDECVDSIIGQTEPAAEILLIDDGSHSAEVDAALTRWAMREPQRIRLLRQPNRGVCVARNTMLAAMTGDAFVLVDADDVLDATFIEKTATALRANPGLDAVATWTEFFGAYCGVEAKPPFDARVGRRENPIVSTCVLVDMAVRDRGIRFDPDLAFIYCEDWDFWAQLVATRGEFGLVPEPLARHRVHETSGGNARSELALRIGKARATSRFLASPPK